MLYSMARHNNAILLTASIYASSQATYKPYVRVCAAVHVLYTSRDSVWVVVQELRPGAYLALKHGRLIGLAS